MTLDVERLVSANPLLAGDGLIAIGEAAKAIGLSEARLLGELLNDRARVFTLANQWHGWQVECIDDVERDYDGAFISSSVIEHGHLTRYSGPARLYDATAALSALITQGVIRESGFLIGGGGFFLDDVTEIPLAACMTQKSVIERVRVRLATGIRPEHKTPVTAPTTPVPERAAITDAVTVKHGKKKFSTLFALVRTHRRWGQEQVRRMNTEAGLFIELMGDPELGDIEVETIHEFARRLSLLPSDIYLSRRRFKVESLDELIVVAERESLPRKNENTVRGHVGRIAEILNFAVGKGMMHANPAAGFMREWGTDNQTREQDARLPFTPSELERIFSQDWFANGAGKVSAKGLTQWRPHYYWLPLLALLTGGRLNELAQLYLDDVRQSESGDVWYLDFNMTQPDKVNDSEPDKSLKTVNAIRVVPLHEAVIAAGLPDYVRALRKDGHTRLFPELKRDDVKGYGKPVGSWFNERFLGKLGFERNGMKTFHSFRHTFATALERLDMTERVKAQLMGHMRGKTQSDTRYAKDRGADELMPIINRLDFPCLARLKPFNVQVAKVALKCAAVRKVAAARRKPRV